MLARLDYWFVAIDVYDGEAVWNAEVRWNTDDHTLTALDDAGNYVVVATDVDLFVEFACWHTNKLVVDMETHRYVRCLLNDLSVDLSAIAMQTSASSRPPFVTNRWGLKGRDGANDVAWTDDLILTQNEPA